MPNLTINAKHPVRNEVAGLDDYYDSLSEAFDAVETILENHGMALNMSDMPFLSSEGGSWLAPIVPAKPIVTVDGVEYDCEAYNNGVNFSYYKLGSGRWEVVTYVS